MNETAVSIDRTPQVIATEINSIKSQTRNIMLQASIEIGHRLIEAKALVPHGEWGSWLQESVDYSERTAQNLMRIYEEYGNKQIGMFDEANAQALADLTYTQAVALLGIPTEERGEFAEQHDVASMSTRELQQAIKERDEARKEREQLRKELESKERSHQTISESYKRLEQVNSKHYQNLQKVTAELEEAQSAGASDEEIKELKEQLQAAQEKVKELEAQATQPVTLEPTVVEKVPEEVEKELQELREKVKTGDQRSAAILKFRLIFDVLIKDFNELLTALAELKTAVPDEYNKYENAVLELIEKMADRV